MQLIRLKKLPLLSFALSAIFVIPALACSAKAAPTISVINALDAASKVLSGEQLRVAQKRINERSIGGERIAESEFYDIINPQAAPVAGAAAAGAGAGAKKKNENENVNTWPVPPALQGKVTYLRTDQQETNECGFRAVFFAKVISELALATINRQTIDTAMKQDRFKKLICQKFIGDEQVVKLAQDQDIKNFYVLAYDKADKIPLIMQRTSGSPEGIDEILVRLKTKFNERAYFAINTGNHWVLIAVVKPLKLGEKPRVFYLNSLNDELTESANAYPQLLAIIKGLGL